MSTATGFPIARELMKTAVYTLQAEEPVFEAAGRLLRQGYSGAPVLDGTRLVGVVTEFDLMRAFACVHEGRTPETAVRDVMTADPIRVGPEVGLHELCERFTRDTYRRLPVVDDGELLGIVARRDVLRALHRYALQMRRAGSG